MPRNVIYHLECGAPVVGASASWYLASVISHGKYLAADGCIHELEKISCSVHRLCLVYYSARPLRSYRIDSKKPSHMHVLHIHDASPVCLPARSFKEKNLGMKGIEKECHAC